MKKGLAKTGTKKNFWARLRRDLVKYWDAYILVIPIVVYFIVFKYKPMYGVIIAFKNFSPGAGIWGSKWADNFGFEHFLDFFDSYYFERLIRNTLTISVTSLVLSFPAPIIFALLVNEIKNMKYKRLVQTISYMPHFISAVVVCGMIRNFVAEKGFITSMLVSLGMKRTNLLSVTEYFVPIYVLSGIWQNLGWSAIIYLSALSGIDQQLYEAAKIDGANRWRQTLHVTLPGIAGTIIIMLLMRLGNLMDIGHEKIILLYNEGIYESADVISTFVYRKGLVNMQWSYSSAIGLFNSVINFIIVFVFNRISRKMTEISLW